jgi:hypothetical protein
MLRRRRCRYMYDGVNLSQIQIRSLVLVTAVNPIDPCSDCGDL